MKDAIILTEIIKHLSSFTSIPDLQNIKAKYLGKQGQITLLMQSLAKLDPESKKIRGGELNQLKNQAQELFDSAELKFKADLINQKLVKEQIDISRPGILPLQGMTHPLTKVTDEVCDIFKGFGFFRAEGPEIETDLNNFELLNFQVDHPARDMQDTFYLAGGLLLRTHTSPVQVRVMQKLSPPLAMIAPGVVYRRDHDQTHSPMFHQLEGLLIDKDVHFGHLKFVIQEFLSRFFNSTISCRFRASYFPFTEPSAEVDMSCPFCVKDSDCKVCKNIQWIEIMGCGMVHPNVLQNCKIDPHVFSGFAFGVGLERLAMLKYGIPDLRMFYNNDIRFLKSVWRASC